MPLGNSGITPDHVLGELAEIAFAVPGEEGAPPVKTADKLRALEMIYRHLHMGEGGTDAGVTIVDDVAGEVGTSKSG